MASRRRMNVALTRAKKALYIVGHLDSLKVRSSMGIYIVQISNELIIHVLSVSPLTGNRPIHKY